MTPVIRAMLKILIWFDWLYTTKIGHVCHTVDVSFHLVVGCSNTLLYLISTKPRITVAATLQPLNTTAHLFKRLS